MMKNIKDEYTVREIGKHLGLDPRRTQQPAMNDYVNNNSAILIIQK
jgi:hypothetical protein